MADFMLRSVLSRFIRSACRACGFSIQPIRPTLDVIRDNSWRDLTVALDVVTSLHARDLQSYRDFYAFAADRKMLTHAQNYQDLFVLWTLHERRSGTFVEFGADDGVTGSNSLLLERDFDWQGLLLEPNRSCHASLARNRHCMIDHRAVAAASGQHLPFVESTHRQLSRLASYEAANDDRPPKQTYDVATVALDDVLEEYGIPRGFDLLSIDVEGAELAVLAGFTVAKWQPSIVIIEHNARTADYDRIEQFFLMAGYTKCLPGYSRNDLWLVHSRT